MCISIKTEIPDWLFEDNVFASTALRIMLEENEAERTKIMLEWEKQYKTETDPCWKDEALGHYEAAVIACLNMGAHKVTTPFPGWHTHLFQKIDEPWWDWMKRELSEAGTR